MEPTVEVTGYTVHTFPLDHPLRERFNDLYVYDLGVEYRDEGRWAVVRLGSVWTPRGGWEWEPSPSNRTPAFKKRTRFSLDKALEHAKTAARKLQADTLGHLKDR